MKKVKQLLSVLLALLMLCSSIPLSVSAASLFDQRVSQLREKFPNNSYWNHAVYEYYQRGDVLLENWDNSYGDSVTWTPCATHNGQPGYGQCDCNAFDGGIQCWGFANRIFYGIFGVYASGVGQRWDTQNVAKGDWIRLENENHSAVVLARNGNTLTIVEGNRNGNCKIVWDRQVNLSSVNWFKHAPDSVWEEVMRDFSGDDLGDDFYAYIAKQDTGKYIEATSDGNVQIAQNGNNSNDPHQIWHFIRQSNTSYKIQNAYDNSFLDVSNSQTANGTNVLSWRADTGGANQRWFIKNTSKGYRISPSFATSKALDVYGDSNENGTNVEIWDWNGSTAQLYMIAKTNYSKPASPPASRIYVSNLGSSSTPTTLSWTTSALRDTRFDERVYDLRIWKGTKAEGDTYKMVWGLKGTSYQITLPAGTYTANISPVNAKYYNLYTYGESTSFTVPNHTHSYTSKITKAATCSETGVRTYTCSCGNSYTETIAKNSSNHVNTKNIAATASTCIANGYTAGVYCNDCKKYISGHQQQALSGHQTTVINAKTATYDAEGYTGDEYCTVCKRTIKTGTAIPKLEKPTQPTQPNEPQQQSDACPWCGGSHSGFLGSIVGFFHRIFAALFGARH